MPMQDLTEFLEPWLDLPIRGKNYRVAAVDAATGLYAQNVVEVAAQVKFGGEISDEEVARLKLDDDQERDFNRRMLPGVDADGNTVEGGVYDEMLADQLPWEYIKHAARTVFLWTVQDRDVAEQHWAGGGRPEAQRPEPQDHKAPAKKKTKKSGRQGSGGGKKKTSAPPPASAGTDSSATGT